MALGEKHAPAPCSSQVGGDAGAELLHVSLKPSFQLREIQARKDLPDSEILSDFPGSEDMIF